MKLYLIRHPRPINVGGLCYGRRDVPVDPASVSSTAAAVRARITEAVLSRAEIHTSPSSRCLLLAHELAAPREPVVADDLVEMSFGSWEGQSWDAVPRDQLDAWSRDVWNYRTGGGESAAMVAERWQRWVALARPCRGDTAVAITHAGVIRIALAGAGLLSMEAFAQAPIAFGSVHCLDLDSMCAARTTVHNTACARA